ncbi:PKD domain-containing protein [Planctomycetota bacterium]
MKRKSILALAIVALMLATGMARADFVFTGTQHMDVTSNHSMDVLWDSSSVNILSGYVDRLDAWNFSAVELSGGNVSKLNAWNSPTVSILPGALVNCPFIKQDNSSVVISGGFFAGNLTALDNSSVAITGGNIRGDHNTYLIARSSSTVNISGGRVQQLSAYGTSNTTFYGYDFTGTGSISFDGDKDLGTGELYGKWFDGTTWTTNINIHDAGATILDVSEPPNSSPIADAGPDQSVFVADTVFLDGYDSSDEDGDSLTYYWSFISMPLGSATILSNPTAIAQTFVVDKAGTYEVQLIVNDGTDDSESDAVVISTLNSAPVADAGPNQMLLVPIGVAAEVILDGSGSTDIDGDELTYQWTWDTYSVDGVNPTIELSVRVHTIQLNVNDGTVDSEPDYVTIEVVGVTIALVEKISSVLTDVLTDKISLLEQIKNANEKEQQVYDTLEELLDSGVYTGLAHSDMVEAKQKIHSALQHQELAIQDLGNSIEKLTDVLDSLGAPVEP